MMNKLNTPGYGIFASEVNFKHFPAMIHAPVDLGWDSRPGDPALLNRFVTALPKRLIPYDTSMHP